MIDRIFREGVAPLLAPLGFQYGPGRLSKSGPDYLWLMQILADGDSRFGVGLGVHYPSLWAAAQSKPGMTNPDWEICAQQTTLGRLWKGKDYRWKLGPQSDIKPIVEEITVLLLELGLPWLGQRKDWRSVLADEQAQYRDVAATLIKGNP